MQYHLFYGRAQMARAELRLARGLTPHSLERVSSSRAAQDTQPGMPHWPIATFHQRKPFCLRRSRQLTESVVSIFENLTSLSTSSGPCVLLEPYLCMVS